LGNSRPGEEGQDGSGRSIEIYLADAQSMGAEAFAERHGAAFLILTAAGLKANGSTTSTEVVLLDEDEACERTEGVSVLVFPIRRPDGRPAHLITSGRTSDNDIVIPDISISRLHAFFKRDRDGVFVIQDSGSTNGTTVNGSSVATKATGSPTRLQTGDSVRLGQMDLTFLEAGALRDFVLKFGD
jgi:hypothetical protein